MTNGIISNTNTNDEEMSKRLHLLKQILSNRSEITIIGHDNIDVDSVLSGVLLSKLLNFLNIKSNFIILQPIKRNDTYEIISTLTNINMYDYEERNENELRNLFLVDHFETTHKGNVLGCIDHHFTEKKNTYEFSYVKHSSATAYLIYELMKIANYPLTDEDAKLIIIAMMVDTVSFRSTKAIPAEIDFAKALANKFNIDYGFLEKYSLCLTPIEKMNIDEITSNGQKQYNYNGHMVTASYLQLYGMPNEESLNNWISYLHNKLFDSTLGIEMHVFIIFDTKLNITHEYQINQHYTKKLIHDGILSRGKDISPKIEKRFLHENILDKQIETIIKNFSKVGHTIATMESCTGGSLVASITNISGASDILHESYVTYCNDSKVKLGVPKHILEKYSVYSLETAKSMANAVRLTANSDIGVGVTGQLGRIDPQNVGVENNKAWYCITSSEKEISAEITLNAEISSRIDKKEIIVKEIIGDLYRW